MRSIIPTAIGAVMLALCVPLFIANIPHTDEAVELAVFDKAAPIMEAAYEAEPEPEPEEAYVETYAYEPTYYSPWYESDDEEAELSAKEWIAQRESGGDYEARNGRYIGRYQLDSSYLDGDYSEENQEEVAEAYVADRYGSWEAAREFWERNGWY